MTALDLEALAPPGIGRTVMGDVKAAGVLAGLIAGKPGSSRGDVPGCRKSNSPMGEAGRSSRGRVKIENLSPGP